MYFLRERWRWVVTLSLFIQNGAICGFLYNYSILFLSLQDEFKAGAALTGWLGSLANSLVWLLNPLSSLVLRKSSCRTAAVLAMLTYCAGLLATSLATEFWYLFLTFGVIVGSGANLCLVSMYTSLGLWFPDKYYCRAVTFVLMGSSTGMVSVSILLPLLISQCGWRTTLRLLSAAILVIGVVTALPMNVPCHPPAQIKQYQHCATDEEEGVLEATRQSDVGQSVKACLTETLLITGTQKSVDGDALETRVVRVVKGSRYPEESTGERDGEKVNWFHVLALGDTWLWFIGVVLANNAYTFAVINLASFMDDLDFTSEHVTVVISLFAVGESCGKLIIAMVGQHLPFSLLYIPVATSLVAAVVPGLMTVVSTFRSVIILSFVFGVMRSGLYGPGLAITNQLFGQHGLQVVNAMAMLPYGVGILIAAPIVGGLYDATGDYNIGLLLNVGCFLASVLFFVSIPIKKRFGRCG